MFIFLTSFSFSQNAAKDTLQINIHQAEKIFRDNNLQLLAQRYNIDAQRALILQAKLWPNPNFSVSQGPIIPIYDPTSQYPHSNFFYHSEMSAGISQLILLAGKRNKQIKLATANTSLAEYQFFDLLRTLKYSLRSVFFNIYYLQQSSKVYETEIKALQKVVSAYSDQQGKGYIAEKEVVRIRAQLYSFREEYVTLANQIKGLESELRLIVQVKPTVYIAPVIDADSIAKLDPSKYPLASLIDSAFRNRTDLQVARTNTEINKITYNYQKALAVPDLTLGISYDKQGSYANNFTALGASIDLPFFNHNQGNIKSAKFMIENTAALQKSIEATVEENITNSLDIAYSQDSIYKTIDPKFSNDFERLADAELTAYQKRTVGLLEFLDFYDAFKQNVLQVNTILYNRVQAFEDINFYTATNFFN
ncbi:MAG: TolC family protein [Bacteroidetes bacterium]|nr:TolC family protein [Bacteroidota bacterium]